MTQNAFIMYFFSNSIMMGYNSLGTQRSLLEQKKELSTVQCLSTSRFRGDVYAYLQFYCYAPNAKFSQYFFCLRFILSLILIEIGPTHAIKNGLYFNCQHFQWFLTLPPILCIIKNAFGANIAVTRFWLNSNYMCIKLMKFIIVYKFECHQLC